MFGGWMLEYLLWARMVGLGLIRLHPPTCRRSLRRVIGNLYRCRNEQPATAAAI